MAHRLRAVTFARRYPHRLRDRIAYGVARSTPEAEEAAEESQSAEDASATDPLGRRVIQLTIRVHGRPAPQGSHELGANGRVAPAGEAYLNAWRTRVRNAAVAELAARGIGPTLLPLYPRLRPVVIESLTFFMLDEQCHVAGTDEPVGTPDVDKLLRATLDALSTSKPGARFRGARLYADDSQVVMIRSLSKQRARGTEPGALIVIREWES